MRPGAGYCERLDSISLNDKKLSRSFVLLDAALGECEAEPENALRFAALAKAFETTFEYVWKHFKREADQA